MLLIDHRYPVVALDHSMVGRHLGALRIGDVALALASARAEVLGMGSQELFDLFDLALVGDKFLLVLVAYGALHFFAIPLPVSGDDLLCCDFVLPLLVSKFVVGPAPFLGGIGWQLAPV